MAHSTLIFLEHAYSIPLVQKYFGSIPRGVEVNAFLQYNTGKQEFSSNIRFHIIHRPLSDFYVVFNERRDTQTGQLLDRALVIKFTQMFSF